MPNVSAFANVNTLTKTMCVIPPSMHNAIGFTYIPTAENYFLFAFHFGLCNLAYTDFITTIAYIYSNSDTRILQNIERTYSTYYENDRYKV